MTPKEKAKDLLRLFSFIEYDQNEGIKIANPTLKEAAKQCAWICVKELLDSFNALDEELAFINGKWQRISEYWQQVLTEIQNQ